MGCRATVWRVAGVSWGCTWGPWFGVGFDQVPFPGPGPHVLTYRASLDVPVDTVARVSGWIQAHRREVDTRPWERRRRGMARW